jgi:oxygen-independent coproporphyrinogen-3 oxidase
MSAPPPTTIYDLPSSSSVPPTTYDLPFSPSAPSTTYDLRPSPSSPSTIYDLPSTNSGVYVHIPFCISRCSYCDFASYPLGRLPEGVSIGRYVNALIAEIRLRSESAGAMRFDTIYFGGGTPSILDSADIASQLTALREAYDCTEVSEITIEANPDTLTSEKLKAWSELGIKRLSIGVQSLQDEVLRLLGRTYTSNSVLSTFESLRDEIRGFSLSFDLMLCIPNQQTSYIANDIRHLTAFNPDHFSIYALKLEPGTPLASRLEGTPQAILAEERYADEMKFAEDTLAAEGFVRYEISNFARNERWSLHNLNYWNCGEYIGLGLNASGHVAGRRWRNHRNMEDYLRAVESGALPEAESEVLTPGQRIFERIMLALRTRWGLQQDAVPPEIWNGLYANALALNGRLPGFVNITTDSVAPTSSGMNVEHALFLELIEGVL